MRYATLLVLAAAAALPAQCSTPELVRSAPKAQLYRPTATQAVVYDARPELGVGMHGINGPALDMVQRLGLRFVRHTLYWNKMETTETPGLYDGHYLSQWDALTEECRRRGICLVVVIHGDPPGVSYENREQAYERFARFAADMAARYSSVIYWELFNEMDSGFTCLFGAMNGVSMRERGANYARMLKKAYPALRAANPAAWVVCGGMSDTGEFPRGIYEAGGRQFFDIMNIHTYGVPVLSAFVERAKQVRTIMAEFDDRDKPLWNTEFGLDAGNVVAAWGYPHSWNPPQDDGEAFDARQLEDIRNCVVENSRLGLYQKIFIYQFQAGNERDDAGNIREKARLPEGRTIDDYGFGIVRRDMTPRPAYVWLQEADVNRDINSRPRFSANVLIPTRSPMLPIGFEFRELPGGTEVQRVVIDSLVPARIDLLYRAEQPAAGSQRTRPEPAQPRKGTRPIPDPFDI